MAFITAVLRLSAFLFIKSFFDFSFLFTSDYNSITSIFAFESQNYVITKDLDLGSSGNTLTIPNNCTLTFEGGSVDNGTVSGNNTTIVSQEDATKSYFKNVNILGTFFGVDDKLDNTDGMGRIILRKDKTFAEQLTQENTIYVIRYDFDLGEGEVTIPANCVLQFDGGSLSNGNVTFSNTKVRPIKSQYGVFRNVSILGSVVGDIDLSWFVNELDSDITDALEKCAAYFNQDKTLYPSGIYAKSTNRRIVIPCGNYRVDRTINFDCYGVEIDFNGSSITCTATNLFNFDIYWLTLTNVCFVNCGNVIKFVTENRDGAMITIKSCRFVGCGICVDSVSYPDSRSTLLTIDNSIFRNCDKYCISYCDKLIIKNSWFNEKDYTSGCSIVCCGMSEIDSCLFVPNGPNVAENRESYDRRYIDFVDTDSNDNTCETFLLKISNSRFGGEHGSKPVVYCQVSSPGNTSKPCLISIKDCHIISLDSKYQAAIVYKKGVIDTIIDGIAGLSTDSWAESSNRRPKAAVIAENLDISNLKTNRVSIYVGYIFKQLAGGTYEYMVDDYSYFSEELQRFIFYNDIEHAQNISASHEERPKQTHVFTGKLWFSTTHGKPRWWNGSKWIEPDGTAAGAKRNGTFSEKPAASDIYVGFKYFCTDRQTTEGATDGIEIIHKGNNVWVDALGRVVS